jgi:di/tricarboxylate transporter
MPLGFAASAGALLALTGSPVNVIVSEASIESGHGGFGFLSFALVGIPFVLGTVAIVVLVGDRLLPERHPRTITPDLSHHARTLIDQYNLDRDQAIAIGWPRG